MSTRLAVVLSHPTQYYSPWFRWLRTHTALEFRVFYLWEAGVTAQRDPGFQATVQMQDVDLLGGYESEFVPNTARSPGTDHFWGLRNPTLTVARLAAWRPGAGAPVRLRVRQSSARHPVGPPSSRAARLPRRLAFSRPARARLGAVTISC